MRTAYLTHADCLKHTMGPGHPEQPARLYAIQDRLIRAGVFDFLHDIDWLPELVAFRPEMIFISAGFDGHYEDDQADWHLTKADYAWVNREILNVAARFAAGRVVSVLEGGYALSALGRSATAHIKTLLEGPTLEPGNAFV